MEQDIRYIPINKGHFELDTESRKKAFSKKLSYGWEKDYKEYRRLWEDLPVQNHVRDYPLLVDLELSSMCNLKCPMCYTNTELFKSKVKKQLMDLDLFKKIIDEIAGNVYAIRLSLRGEPTLHPNFVETISYAKKKGIKEISTLTHGGNLNLNFFKEITDSGIDWISISVDGTDEHYNAIRRPLKFQDTLQRLKDIQTWKDEQNFKKPVIKVQGVWPAIRHDPTKYYNLLSPVSDLVSFNPLIDYLRNDDEIVYVENFSCPQLYQRIVVGSDGRVLLCSNDEDGDEIIGNAYEETIHEIWHGSKMNRIRDIHCQKDGFKSIKVCKQCYYPRKAIPDEKAFVNDRLIYIENYVNRKQKVGA